MNSSLIPNAIYEVEPKLHVNKVGKTKYKFDVNHMEVFILFIIFKLTLFCSLGITIL